MTLKLHSCELRTTSLAVMDWVTTPLLLMKRVLCLIADGFEEIETITPIDLLRRAGVDVRIAAVGDSMHVTGRSGVVMHADSTLSQVEQVEDFDLLLLPGGPQVKALRADGRAASLAASYFTKGRPVAAICAAPLILKDAGLLEGASYTAHFSTRDELPEAASEVVVTHGHLITSQGAGTAFEFALQLVYLLAGAETAQAVAASIMLNRAWHPA
jgi:protein deglycase